MLLLGQVPKGFTKKRDWWCIDFLQTGAPSCNPANNKWQIAVPFVVLNPLSPF